MADRATLYNDPEETFRIAFEGRQSNIWTSLPGIVTEVNLMKMTVSVQPSIQGVVENENGVKSYVNLPVLVDVPLHFLSGGGFTITVPVAINDEVLVVFSSRCIDSWWQSGGIGKPMEARMHDLSDGFAIPGVFSQPKVISGVSSSAVQVRNNAGTSYIEIHNDGKINIVAPSGLYVTGDIHASGEVYAGTTPLHTHVHGGVQTGGGSTGGPVP